MSPSLRQKEEVVEAFGPVWTRFLVVFKNGRDLKIRQIEQGAEDEATKASLRATEEDHYAELVDLILATATDAALTGALPILSALSTIDGTTDVRPARRIHGTAAPASHHSKNCDELS